MTTIQDITDDGRISGFAYVNQHPDEGRAKRFRAQVYYTAAERRTVQANAAGHKYLGKWRKTAIEAAQDYCDYVNSGATPATQPAPSLRSAGHKRTTPRKPRVMSARERQLRAELSSIRGELQTLRRKRGLRGFIYCIAEQYGEPDGTKFDLFYSRAVKVGWAEDPEQRIKALQTANPRVLKILGTIPGTEDDEKALHAELQSDNVLQEWFRPTNSVLSKFGLARDVRAVDCFTVREV